MLLNQSTDDETLNRRSQWLSEVLELLKKLNTPAHIRSSVQGLLCILFPDLAAGDSDTCNREADRLRWAQEKRVCSPDAFDRFFSLAGEGRDSDEVGGSVDDGVASDPGIRKLFQHARRTGQILELLGELVGRRLTASQAMRVAKTICASDTRDDLQLEDMQGSYELVGDVVKNCMRCYGQGNEFGFLRQLIHSDGSLFTVSKVIEETQPDKVVVTQNAQQLRNDLGGRILRDAPRERFWDGNRWYYLLCVARRLGRSTEVLETVEGRVVERRDEGDSWYDDRLLRFCETFSDAVRADRRRGTRGERVEDIGGWMPEDTKERLRMLVNGDGHDAARARAIAEDLWGGS